MHEAYKARQRKNFLVAVVSQDNDIFSDDHVRIAQLLLSYIGFTKEIVGKVLLWYFFPAECKACFYGILQNDLD